jgi:putative ABC transport system permease protein
VLTEGMTISLLGGGIGVLLAVGGVRVFRALQPGDIPRADGIAIDYRVLGFALLVSIVTGIVFSLLPALHAMRTNASAVLKENASNSTLTGGRRRVQSGLVIAEIALSLVLLTGAGLMFASMLKLQSVNPGFRTDQVITIPLQVRDVAGPPALGDEAARNAALVQDMMARVAGVAGVQSVGAGLTAPFDHVGGGRCCWQTNVRPSFDVPAGDGINVSINTVTPGYFSALAVRIVAGRDFTSSDATASPPAALINSEMAHRLYGDASPVGRTVVFGSSPEEKDPTAIVVGVVDAIHHFGSDRPVDPQVYLPYERFGSGFPILTLIVRTSAPVGTIGPALRDAIWAIAPDVPIDDMKVVSDRVNASFSRPRFLLVLLGTFALTALLLAVGGIYGTLLYSVRRRQRELGIRLALGADRASIVGLVVRHGVVLITAGVILGLAGSIAGTRLLESMLFGVSTTDRTTFVAVAAVLACVALIACWIPAAKAARTDPMRTLRTE